MFCPFCINFLQDWIFLFVSHTERNGPLIPYVVNDWSYRVSKWAKKARDMPFQLNGTIGLLHSFGNIQLSSTSTMILWKLYHLTSKRLFSSTYAIDFLTLHYFCLVWCEKPSIIPETNKSRWRPSLWFHYRLLREHSLSSFSHCRLCRWILAA